MSRIQRILTVFTSLGAPFNYTLQATVPAHFLSKCSSSLPRPEWEPALYYTILCLMGFVLFFILVASYFEADRIFVADILRRKIKLCNGSIPYNKDKIFDLKSIGVSQNTTPTTTSVKPVPTVLRVNHPTATQPVIEISNGHIEQKSKEPFLNALFGIIKGWFKSRPTSGRKKNENNNIEGHSSIIKSQSRSQDGTDIPLPAPKPTVSDKEKPPGKDEVAVPEKSSSSYSQQKLTHRKPKAARRSFTDISAVSNPINSSNSGNYERKPGNNKNSTANSERKFADQNNTVKDKTATPNTTISDSSGLSLFDVPDSK